jgi:hypothetical protein
MKSIGADFDHGGYGRDRDRGWDGFKVIDPDSPVFAETGLRRGDVISLSSAEYDGTLLAGFDGEGYPVADRTKLGFHFPAPRVRLGSRGGQETVGTWLVMRRAPPRGSSSTALRPTGAPAPGSEGRTGRGSRRSS